MTQKSRSDLQTEINANLADNTSRAITPADVRQVSTDQNDSAFNKLSDTSDNVTQGGVNLFFTQAAFNTAFGNKTTSDLAEGTNLYYTNARWDAEFATKTTDDLPEGGNNFYFTNSRAQDAVGGILNDTADINFTYLDDTSIEADLTATGVTSGTYIGAQVTVDSKGRITAITSGAPGTGDVSGLSPVIAKTVPRYLDATGKIIEDSGQSQILLEDTYMALTTDAGAFGTPYVTISPTAISLAGLGSGGVDMGLAAIQIGHATLIEFNTAPVRFNALTASTVPYLDASKNLVSSAVTPTTLSYLDATSSIQTQLNGKQPTGNYITALTGDVSASGAGSVTATLATVNSNVGSFGSATQVAAFTVNGKGLTTAASNVSIAIPSTQVTDFTEAAQDAVGAMVNTSLTYNDATPSLGLTSRTIGGVAYDGTANIVPQTIQVADAASDTTTFPMLAGAATGNLQPLTDAGLTYDASTNNLTTTTFTGALSGNATSATTATTATNATNIGTANEAADTTCFPVFVTASGTQTLPGKTNTGLTYNSSTNNLGATTFTGALSGNATTATALATPRTIGGVSFDGSANIVPQTIESANEGTDTTCFPLFITASGTQSLQPKNNASFIYNSNTNNLTCNVTGNVSGSSGSTTGNAATAAALQNARTIGGVSFDGTANIVPQTIQSVNEATDTTCFPLFISASGSQSLQPLNNTSFTFNANTAVLGVAGINFGGTTLSVYSEGTWTPVPRGSGTAGTPTGTFNGNYTKVGRQVTVTCQLVFTALTGMVGNLEVTGLPYTVANAAAYRAGVQVAFRSNWTNDFVIQGYTVENTTTIRFMNGAADNTAVVIGDMSATTNLYFSITYQAA